MSSLPEWYLPYFPELRSGPPWVTEEMVEAEPGLARKLGGVSDPAAALAPALERAWGAGEWLTVVGSGTSEYAAMAVAEVLEEARRAIGAGGAVEVLESFEASLDPRAGGVLLAISHGGRSRAAVAALEAARERGRTTALVTAAPLDTPVALAADLHVVTPLADRSFCHTVGYLSPILAAATIAAELTGAPLDTVALAEHLQAALATRDPAAAVAARLHGGAQYVTSGSGADQVAARELSLKIEEAVRLPAAMRGLETLLHGHLVPADERTRAIVLVTDRRGRAARAERARTALRACRRLGVETALVATPDVAERAGPELASAGVILVGDDERLPPAVSSLVASALALQTLTLALVREAGVNPDLIRREEAPYREAAVLTEAKIR